ncbi:LOW QUALITY PROTEIN: hypothetical protein YC2023_087051 [Brassica napus]
MQSTRLGMEKRLSNNIIPHNTLKSLQEIRVNSPTASARIDCSCHQPPSVCLICAWRDAPDMRVATKRPESALIDGKIYLEEEQRSLRFSTWNPLPSISEDDDYPEVQLRRGELFATTSNHKKYAFDPKQGTWKEHRGLPYTRNEPWCVIDNVKFSVLKGRLMWYERGNWFSIKDLKDVCTKPHVNHHTTILLANHGGGSILVIWDELHSLEFPGAGKMRKHVCKNRRIWCVLSWRSPSSDWSLRFGGRLYGRMLCLQSPNHSSY